MRYSIFACPEEIVSHLDELLQLCDIIQLRVNSNTCILARTGYMADKAFCPKTPSPNDMKTQTLLATFLATQPTC